MSIPDPPLNLFSVSVRTQLRCHHRDIIYPCIRLRVFSAELNSPHASILNFLPHILLKRRARPRYSAHIIQAPCPAQIFVTYCSSRRARPRQLALTLIALN